MEYKHKIRNKGIYYDLWKLKVFKLFEFIKKLINLFFYLLYSYYDLRAKSWLFRCFDSLIDF
jgi:hypothetical protein